jgi:protease-4
MLFSPQLGVQMVYLLFLTTVSTSFAENDGLSTSPPTGNAASMDGAWAQWVNPANNGFDPDMSTLAYFSSGEFGEIFGFGATADGSGFGAIYRNPTDSPSLWTMTSAWAPVIAGDFRFGMVTNWHLTNDNFKNSFSWDAGLAYRPASWLGFGATAKNILSDREESFLLPSYSSALVLRTSGGALELGSEVIWPTEVQPLTLKSHIGADLAFGLRAFADVALTDGNGSPPEFRAGLSYTVSGTQVGGFSVGDFGETGAWLTSTPSSSTTPTTQTPLFDLTESYPYTPFKGLFSDGGEPYISLLSRLDTAVHDESVSAVAIKLGGGPFSWAQVAELRSAIERLQGADKEVIAWVEGFATNTDAVLLSYCDRAVAHPGSMLALTGVAAELTFFRGTLDLLGVEPQFTQQGDYKSAVETFTRTNASEPAIEQVEALLDNIYGTMVEALSTGDADGAALIDHGPFTAQEALDAGIFDELAYFDEFEESMADSADHGATNDSYMSTTDTPAWARPHRVAVIYVEGAIVSGESSGASPFSSQNAGSDTIVRAIESASNSDEVKALVLRVDSPGGSAYASEEIWHALERFKESGKPLVVSMGGVAASGGYYVAANADVIFAEPTTITGSIGAFAGTFSLAGLYERMGITTETLTRGRMAAIFSSSRRMDPVEFEAFDRLAEDTYIRFRQTVADGRDMSVEDVESVASGRVWSGADAMGVGLVDEMGGFQEAIDRARELAEIGEDDYSPIVTLDGRKPRLQAALGLSLSGSSFVEALLPVGLPDELRLLNSMRALSSEHVFLMMPALIEVR